MIRRTNSTLTFQPGHYDDSLPRVRKYWDEYRTVTNDWDSLPFISQGGSALIANMAGIGLMMSMRYHYKSYMFQS